MLNFKLRFLSKIYKKQLNHFINYIDIFYLLKSFDHIHNSKIILNKIIQIENK